MIADYLGWTLILILSILLHFEKISKAGAEKKNWVRVERSIFYFMRKSFKLDLFLDIYFAPSLPTLFSQNLRFALICRNIFAFKYLQHFRFGAGQEGCRIEGMQDYCRGMQDQEGEMQEREGAGQVGCRIGGMQNTLIEKNRQNWFQWIFVDGVEWKLCIVDNSMIYDFHS